MISNKRIHFFWINIGPIKIKLQDGKAFVECKEINKNSIIDVTSDFFKIKEKNKFYIPFNIVPGKGFDVEAWFMGKEPMDCRPDYTDNNYVLAYAMIPQDEGFPDVN